MQWEKGCKLCNVSSFKKEQKGSVTILICFLPQKGV